MLSSNRIILALTLLFNIVLMSCRDQAVHEQESPTADDSLQVTPVPDHFGLFSDSFLIERERVKRNQTFAGIMYELGVPQETLTRFRAQDSVFNTGRIRANADVYIYRAKNDSTPRYWIYQPDPVNWVKFHLTPPYTVVKGQNRIHPMFRAVHGEIHSSLWDAAAEYGFPFELALQLADIYAWTIDFFDLKTGDIFDVLYEEEYVDTVFTGISRIFAARFVHDGDEIYAIPFIQDSTESYFDQYGNSLKRAFLKAPLHFRRISSRFSYSRLHPILKIRRPHFGVDYAAPVGTPVHTVGDGKVIYMKQTSGAGKMVKIRHNSIYTTAYLHLSHYAKGLYPGKKVRQGDVIGYVGSTGLSTGPHLDFRFYKNGTPVDPLKIKSPPVTPVKPENMARFDSVKTVMIRLIQTIK